MEDFEGLGYHSSKETQGFPSYLLDVENNYIIKCN